MLHNGPSNHRRLQIQKLRIESLEHRMFLNADITFAEGLPHQVSVPANDAATVADVNLDGTLDIVTSGDETTAMVLLGKGDGIFAEPRRTAVPSPTRAIAADFDGDGYVDLASSGENPGVLRIALNQGVTDTEWASFGRAEIISTYPMRFGGFTTGDLDSDGDLDIVVGTNANRVVVFLNNGTPGEQWGGFAEPVEYIRNRNFTFPSVVTTGDMDNDGDLDLLVSNYVSGDLSILLGTGDGQFADPTNYPVGSRGLGRLGVGDLDGDGNLDIVAPHYFDASTSASSGTDRIAVLRGEGDGTLAPVESIPAPGTISTLIAQDLDGDGDLDVAAGSWREWDIHLLANNGDATFQQQDSVPSAGRIASLVGSDLDGDGQIDLVASHGYFDQRLSVHLNTTELPSPPVVTPQPGDADRNGVFDQLDIIVVLQAAKYLTGEPATFAEGDWNADGVFDQLDIIAALAGGNYLSNSSAAHKGDPHGKPGGGDDGGGAGSSAPCVNFTDGGSVQEREPADEAYCQNNKDKVSVSFTQDGHLRLNTSTSEKSGVGRAIYVDFGTDVTIKDSAENMVTFQNTDQLADQGIRTTAGMRVGAFQDDFNFFTMAEGESKDVNLTFRFRFDFPNGANSISSDSLLVRLAPHELDNGRHCPSSDAVTVTYNGIDTGSGQQTWDVSTKSVSNGACISRSGEGELGESNLLTDVDDDAPDLAPGHVALNFSFTVST